MIVCATYYLDISDRLKKDAEEALNNKFSVKTINVPGVFEIPVTIAKNIKKFDGIVALGCVIKGETPHFDFISKTTFEGLMKLSIENKKPVGNGIITALNSSQAEQRSFGDKAKGFEAANAVKSVLTQK